MFDKVIDYFYYKPQFSINQVGHSPGLASYPRHWPRPPSPQFSHPSRPDVFKAFKKPRATGVVKS
jgi:hypothetical protein